MNRLAYEIAAEMAEITARKFAESFSDVKEVKLFWHNLFFLIIATANCLHLNKRARCTLSDLVTLGLLPQAVQQFGADNASLLEDWPIRTGKRLERDFDKLAELRECFLGIELCVAENVLSIRHGKTARDTTGSYYTPYTLARAVVDKTFSKSQVLGLLQEKKDAIRIADLSCGGGEFFLAAQEHLLEKHGISYNISSRFLWGIDIDPVALQITVCRLLDRSTPSDWVEIASHFSLGNPLLSCREEGSLDEKNQLFAQSRVYAPKMGFLFSKWESEKGFDIILGNPPWKKIRFEERKFFSSFAPEISSLSKKDERKQAIGRLKDEWPNLYDWAVAINGDYAAINSRSYRHPLIGKAASGELNTYSLFSELAYNQLADGGLCALLVKSTLVTAPAHQKWWCELLERKAVDSVHLFDNKKKVFHIDSRERFALLTVTRVEKEQFSAAAGLQSAEELCHCREVVLSAEDIKTVNPFTKMLPNVNSTDDIGVLLYMHRHLPPFGDIYPDCHFGRLIHLTAHAQYIDTKKSDDNLPIYEGKFIEQYDARFSTFAGMPDNRKYSAKAVATKNTEVNGQRPLPESRFFVSKLLWNSYLANYNRSYSLCWRSLTAPTNARTMIAMILPTCPTCQSIQMLQTEDDTELIMLLGLFNSLPFDYLVRLKMPGIDLTQSVIRQIPVPDKATYEQIITYNDKSVSLKTHIFSHIRFLLKNEETLHGLLTCLDGLTYEVSGMSSVGAKRTLDDLFANAYHLDEDTCHRIRKTFPKYEQERH